MLKLKNVEKSYGKKMVIKPLNFTFHAGVYGLLGPNGAGKTTLINMLAAVSEPSSGGILYQDKDIFDNNQAYYDSLGYLPQQDALYPNFKALEYLQYMAELKAVPKNQIMRRIHYLAKICNLEGELDKRCKQYSGGMKRRLGLMQAMLNNPKVLILDEPTSGLDPMERIRLRNLISDLSKDRVVIFSTHIVSDIEQVADIILFLRDGRFQHAGDLTYYYQLMDGRVWEIVLSEKELSEIAGNMQIVSVRSAGEGRMNVRFISDQPLLSAKACSPTLEDAFVEIFKFQK